MVNEKEMAIKGAILKVKDIMTKNVKSIAYDETIKNAAENMLKEKVSLLLVVDSSNNQLEL